MTRTEQHLVDQASDDREPSATAERGGRHSRRAGGAGTTGGVSAAELIARAHVDVAPGRSAGHRRAEPPTAELVAAAAAEAPAAASLILLAPVVPPVLVPPDSVGAFRDEVSQVSAGSTGAVHPGATALHPGATALGPSQLSPQPVLHAIDIAVDAVEDRLHPEPMSLDPAVVAAKDRAGRNLPAAIAVGLGLAAVVLVPLFAYRPSFVVVAALAACVAVYEMATAIATVEARVSLPPLLLGAVAMDVAAWARGPDGLVGALLLTVLGLVVWRLADGATEYLRDVAAGQLVALYVPFLAGFAVLLARSHDGAARVVLLVLTVVCSDTGGYIAGVLRGRHPMARTISPKKSWEGFLGSLLASSIAGALVLGLTFHQPWWTGVVFGLAIAVTATLGDLGESMIKRDLALKDMGRLLPGHGGLMDRLDSLLPCAPVAYLLLAAFLKTTT